jgi:hypothetical protein
MYIIGGHGQSTGAINHDPIIVRKYLAMPAYQLLWSIGPTKVPDAAHTSLAQVRRGLWILIEPTALEERRPAAQTLPTIRVVVQATLRHL